MKRTFLPALAGVLLALSLTDATAATDDPVSELIDRIVESQAGIQTIVQRAEMTVTFEMDGEAEEMTQDSKLVYQRPDRLVVESEMMTLVSDGETLSIIFPTLEYLIRTPMEDGFPAALEAHEEYIGGAVLPDVAALLSDNPRAVLKEFAEDISVTVLEDEEHDGRMAWAIQLLVEDDEIEFTESIKVWIDQETGLLAGLAAEVDLSAYHDDGAIPGMPTRYTLRYRVTHRSVNEDIDPDLFAYDTEGFTEVADFDALTEAMQDGMEMPDIDLIGEAAPDFALTLMDGAPFRLSEQRGNVVLVDFWATWCPPCVESLPYLQGMYEELGGDDVVFIGVSVDSPGMEKRVQSMLDRFGIEYLIGINEDGEIAMEYGAFSIPTMVLIDRDGIVQFQKVGFSPGGMEELQAELERLIRPEEEATE